MPTDRLIGQRYLLGARLGRGQLGDIYEARDGPGRAPDKVRHIAIQLIDEQITARPHFAEEFERGAAELRAISHPNIVKWLDSGRDDSRYFLVMERPECASLRFVLDDVMALPIEEAAAIVRAAGDALQHLHAKAIVHGNLTPENVLVTFDYKVKLQDVAPRGWLSRTPEIRDDVYALACLTYELLAGRHPFNANTPSEALRAGLEPTPIDGLSPRQWQAIAGGLALQREHRTPTVAEFLNGFGVTGNERLRAAVSDGPASRRTPAQQAPQPVNVVVTERIAPPRARSRGLLGRLLSFLVVAGLMALTVVYRDSLRDWTAELMVAIDANIREAPVAQPGATAGAPVAARPSDVTAPTGNVIAPAPAPQIDQGSAIAPPVAATAAPDPAARESRFHFPLAAMTISESDVAARIDIQRSGDGKAPASVVWWTSENTAIAGKDYADLGRRVEKFAPGEQSRTIYIPLVNDAVREPAKSFNVYLGRYESGRKSADPIAGLRIDIVDDD